MAQDLLSSQATTMEDVGDVSKFGAPGTLSDTTDYDVQVRTPGTKYQPKDLFSNYKAPTHNITSDKLTSKLEEAPTKDVEGLDYYLGRAKQGLSSLAGLGFDIAKLAPGVQPAISAAQVLGKKHPVESAIDVAKEKSLGVAKKVIGAAPVREPRTLTERYLGEVAEQLGANIIPGIGLEAKAISGAKTLATQAAKITGVSTGAGVGAEAGREVGGEKGALLGSILGSTIAPGYVAAKNAIKERGITSTKSAITGPLEAQLSAKIEQKLATSLQENPKAVANLEEAQRLEQKIQGLKFTAGQSTNIPGFIANEQTAVRSSIANFEARQTLEQAQHSAILDHMIDPNTTQAKGRKAYLDSLNKSFNDNLENLRKESENIKQRVAATSGLVKPKFTAEERGTKLLELRAQEKAQADVIKNQLYLTAKQEADRVRAKFNTSEVHSKAISILDNPLLGYDPANAPTVISYIRTRMADRDPSGRYLPPVGYDEVTSALKAVNQDIKTELSSSNANKRMRLAALSEIKGKLEESITSSQYPTVSRLFAAASDHYKTSYAPRFNKGINAKLAMTDSLGERKVIDENILNQYTKNTTNVDRFLSLFGKNPEAMALMEDHLMDVYSKAAFKEGQFNQAGHNLFMKKNGPVLDKLSNAGIRSLGRMQNIQRNVQTMSNRLGEITANEEALANSTLADLLGSGDHQKIVDAAMQSPKNMGVLTKSLGQEGSKALVSSIMRKATRGMISADPDVVGLDPVKLGKFLDTNGTQLKIAFKAAYGDKEGLAHFDRIKESYRALQIQSRARIGEAIPAADIGKEPLKNAIGITWNTLFSAARAVTAGRASAEHFAGVLGGQAGMHFYRMRFNEIQQRVLTDPEASKDLLKLVKESNLPKPDRFATMKAVMGLLGRAGYVWYGGEFYMPMLGKSAPGIAEQQQRPQQLQREELGPDEIGRIE